MRRAATNNIIFKSVLAIASRQCANLGLIHSEKAEAYHNDCFNALILILNSGPDIADDDLFAAMIMLRTKEEFDSKFFIHFCLIEMILHVNSSMFSKFWF